MPPYDSPRCHICYFSTARAQGPLGRYSYVTADPFAWIWPPSGLINNVPIVLPPADPFDCLADALDRFTSPTVPGLPPFQGGAAGLFPYDLCHYLERLPRPRYYDFAMPDLAVGLYDWVISFDHQENKCWLISTGHPEVEPRRRKFLAEQRREQVQRLLERPPHTCSRQAAEPIAISGPHCPVDGQADVFSNFDKPSYLQALRQAIDYIHAGDCFQVNIAQRLLSPVREPALAVYERLRLRNPAPFAGYFDLGACAIASASPERFVKLQDGNVETRPIKGTSSRGILPEEDFARADQLLDSAQRPRRKCDDRGPTAQRPGPGLRIRQRARGRFVQARKLSDRSPSRLTSRRHAPRRQRPGRSPARGFSRRFGNGQPKIRAMEIITELEQTARGAYCGCLGFIGFDGAMDTSLLIRTFTIGQGWIQFPVGGGIVADSDPEREYEETWHKAAGMLRALAG